MYIVAIAWLYVTLLMATAETSWVAGVMTFAFYGVAPLALLLWLFGIPRRARDRRIAAPLAVDPVAAGAAETASRHDSATEQAVQPARDTHLR